MIKTIIDNPRETGQIWDESMMQKLDLDDLQTGSPDRADFQTLPEFMVKTTWWSSQEKEFEQWIYETDTLIVRSSKTLGISAGPEKSESEFLELCKNAASENYKNDVEVLEKKIKAKVNSLENKIERQQLEVEKYRKNLNTRGLDTALKIGESLLKLASKGKLTGVSSSSSKVRMTAEARSRFREAETILENFQEDLKALQDNFDDKKTELKLKWENSVTDITESKLTPTKQNIRITHFGVLWK